MKYTKITVLEDGESTFADEQVALHDHGAIGNISKPIPVKELMFRETPPDHHHDWHTAPQRQFIVLLDGEIEITVSSGESRTFGGGEILLVEDTTGKGHLTKHIRSELRHSLFITLPEDD